MPDAARKSPRQDAPPHETPERVQTPHSSVTDRATVGTARPAVYPRQDRDNGDASGASNRGKRANKIGSGPVSGSGAGAGGGGNPEDYDSDTQAGGGHKSLQTENGPKTGVDAPIGGSR